MIDTGGTCGRMVTRWVGNPEEPTKDRQRCGRPAKFVLRPEGSRVSVRVCGRHKRWGGPIGTLVPASVEPIGPWVPTVEDLDDLTAKISAAGYASEAVEIVEAWTREHWGVESALTTQFANRYGR